MKICTDGLVVTGGRIGGADGNARLHRRACAIELARRPAGLLRATVEPPRFVPLILGPPTTMREVAR